MASDSKYKVYDNSSFLVQLLKSIRSSKKSVKIQCMSFEADTVGNDVIRELLRAVNRGVEVKLLIDGFTDMSISDSFLFMPNVPQKVKAENLKTHNIFLDFKKQGIKIKRTHNPKSSISGYIFRNHKKLMIFDEKYAFLGGINVSDHNFYWRDFMVRLKTSAIEILESDFNHTWNTLQTKNLYWISPSKKEKVISEDSSTFKINDETVKIVDKAVSKIYLETPYILNHALCKALAKKASEGIIVKVILPKNANHKTPILPDILEGILNAGGVHVYEYKKSGGMTHAKILLADDTVLFGSSNFNTLFALLDDELNMVVKDKNLANQIESFMKKGIKASKVYSKNKGENIDNTIL